MTAERIRVLHLGKYFPPVPGGMETFCADLHRAFAGSEVDSRMLIHLRPGQPTPATPGVRAVPTLGELFFTPLAQGLGRALREEIAQFQPQVLHFHLPNPAAFRALWLPAARRLPWVLHWQSDVLASPHQWRLRLAYPAYRLLEQRLVAQSTRIVATSPDYAAASPTLKGLSKVTVIPLGIDPDRLLPRSEPPGWPGSGLKVLAVGRLTYYKGFEVLLRAIASLPAVSLVLMGDGAQRRELETLVEQLGIGDRVRMEFDADDARRNAALAAADCLCLPSIERTEAFGLVLVEAMALGLPVVATRIAGSGVPWVVQQAEHGLLAQPGDSASLADCLDRLAQDDALRQRLSAAAKKNFESFHIDRVAQRLGALYRTAISA